MYVIIGASGYIASALINRICADSDEEIIAICRSGKVITPRQKINAVTCDIRDREKLLQVGADIGCKNYKVVCLAASHNIDFVENEPDEAALVNISGTRNVLDAFPDFSEFFFSSTDAVYGEGECGRLFTENDCPMPVSEYGRQKLRAESLVAERGGKALRLPYMFGKSETPYKKHFTDEIIEKLRNGEPISLYTDYVRSSLKYNVVADLIFSLFKSNIDLPEIINIASDTLTSKYDIGQLIAEEERLDSSLIIPATIKDSDGKFDLRVKNGGMDNSLLKQLLKLKTI